MTVRELTGNLWAGQRIAIIRDCEFLDCKDMIEVQKRSEMWGNNSQTRSILYKELMDKDAISYGTLEDRFIIEIR